MRFLLDTHTFLWWVTDDDRLSARARELIGDGGNALFLSAASGWEIAIKTALGRLAFAADPEKTIPEQMAANALDGLPVRMSHALRVHALPSHHRDPFDRLLVAQAQLEELSILTNDPMIGRYAVEAAW